MKYLANSHAGESGIKSAKSFVDYEAQFREAQPDLFPETLPTPPRARWWLPATGIALIVLLLLFVSIGKI